MSSYDKQQSATMFKFVESGIYDLAHKIEQLRIIAPESDGIITGMIHYLGEVNGRFHRVRYDYEQSLAENNPDWDPQHGR